ncbi:MAG: heavy metal-associated domain-containing protein [Thermodesulfobacteriota bacterium]
MMIKTKIGALSLLLMFGLLAASLAYGSEFRRTTLQVVQMRCSSCLRVFDAELRKLPGVVGMTAKFREELVIVDHEVGVASKEIADIITGLGYPTTVVSSLVVSSKEANRFQRAGFGAGAGCCNPGGASPVAEAWKEIRRRLFQKGKRLGSAAEVQP